MRYTRPTCNVSAFFLFSTPRSKGFSAHVQEYGAYVADLCWNTTNISRHHLKCSGSVSGRVRSVVSMKSQPPPEKKIATHGSRNRILELPVNNPPPHPYSCHKPIRKALVPRRDECPVTGIMSKANFVTANAVDTILAVPRCVDKPPVNYMEKEDYGKVPKYLKQVKKLRRVH